MIIKAIRKFFNAAHFHRWETTHVNSWQIPTRQICGCGLSRTANAKVGKKLTYIWEYSDGTKSEPLPLGDLE